MAEDPLALTDTPATGASAVTAESRGGPEGPAAGIAYIDLAGSLPESVESPGPWGALQPNLRRLIARIDQAAHDDRIHALWLRPQQTMLGRAQLHEVQQAIDRFRQSGKPSYAELQIATPSDYLVALACQEIWMPESAFLLIPGVRAELTYYQELMHKLHIEPDMMQIGDYKGAAEPYTRSGMSPEFRAQFTQVVDDLYEQLVAEIARRRRLAPVQVRQGIDQAMLTATAAHRAGFIDRVAYASSAETFLQRDLGVAQIRKYPRYGKPELDTELSGMTGLLKLLDWVAGPPSAAASGQRRKVAVVYANGPIVPGDGGGGLWGGMAIGGDAMVRALQQAEQDDQVAAIVVRIDSPGGSALASDLIWQQIRACQKPVVASMANMAASGGYYMAMGCDKIYAEPGTLTGSIGVVGGKFALAGLWQKLGITTDVIARGKNAGILSSQGRFTDSERTAMRDMMEDVYDQFLQKAATSRGKSVEELRPLAEGRLWTGRQAAQNGLVDQVGTLADAIAAARELAGISPQQGTELRILPQPKNLLEQLLESPQTAAPGAAWQALPAPWRATAQRLQAMPAMPWLVQEPVLLWFPLLVDVQ